MLSPDILRNMGGRGLEPATLPLSKTQISEKCPSSGTESGTVKDDSSDSEPDPDPDLALIVRQWPGLPAAVRATVIEIIQEHTPQPERRETL
jgi:hypothetical protein